MRVVDLYALAPEEFTAARDAAAKEDKALKALRKPTVAAWIVNTLVRKDPALLEELAALGASLGQAQQQGQGDELRALTEQRRQLVASLTAHAIGLVDRPVSDAVRAEVEATLDAALADPGSAEAVRSGQLVRALSYAGFGGVDLEGAVAPLPRPVAKKPPNRAKAAAKPDTGAAEAAALDAAGALDDAVRKAEDAARAVDEHQKALVTAQAEEDDAAKAVVAAQDALAATEREQKSAHKRRTELQKAGEALLRRASGATKAVAVAQEKADAARKALDALRRGT